MRRTQAFTTMVLMVLLCTSATLATEIYFQGGSNTKWDKASNWSPAQIPTASDNAYASNTSATLTESGGSTTTTRLWVRLWEIAGMPNGWIAEANNLYIGGASNQDNHMLIEGRLTAGAIVHGANNATYDALSWAPTIIVQQTYTSPASPAPDVNLGAITVTNTNANSVFSWTQSDGTVDTAALTLGPGQLNYTLNGGHLGISATSIGGTTASSSNLLININNDSAELVLNSTVYSTLVAAGCILAEDETVTTSNQSTLLDIDTTTSPGNVILALNPERAKNPSPADNAISVALNSDLSWSAGDSAISHDVYFGTNESAVANAQRLTGDINGDRTVDIDDLKQLAAQWLTDPGAVNVSADIVYSGHVDFEDFAALAANWQQTADPEFKGNQTSLTYDPGSLGYNTPYFWRIDEVNPTNPNSPWTGTVWSFITEDNVPPNTSYSYSDTWVAVDALGRALPNYSECGTPRSDRYVALFYFLTFGAHGPCDTPFNHDGPYDITQLLAANPYNPAYGPAPCYFPQTGAAHHWGQPEMGYYLSDDQWVIRKHAYMLANADVDVIVFDVTNYPRYTSNYMAVCNVFSQVRSEGGTTPQIAFMTNWNADDQVQNLYNEFYSRNYYSDLWFYWKGKPLILGPLNGMADPAGGTISYSSTVLNFFNFRYAWADTAGSGQDIWSWIDWYPQDYGWHDNPSTPEAITVSCGRHANANAGRSYHNGNQPSCNEYYLTGTEHLGLMFDEQWGRALSVDPEFLFITGWNEWVAGRLIIPPEGQPFSGNYPFLDHWVGPGETLFVDCYNQEFSRDIEPMKDGHTDNYYYQMIDGIRRYKGVRKLPTPSVAKTINIDGNFSDWVSVGPEYVDWLGDTMHRSSEGWGAGVTYTNTTGRNDFRGAKVARDDTYVYFYIRTDVNITSYTNSNWMMLFINSDQNYSTGWEGYDYVLNMGVTNSTTTTLKHTTSGWNWTNVNTNIAYRVSGNQMEIRVPRSDIGQGSGSDTVAFDFKWSDNIQNNNDIIEFSVSGDSAPDRRFNYRYDTTTIIEISNPSFESPNVSGHQYLPVGSDWSYAGGGFIIADSGSDFGNTAYQGGQNLILQNEVSVWQTVSGFEIGRDYKVTWAEADRANPYGGNTLRVLIDGNVVGPLHTVTDNNWVVKTSNTFTATSTTHTLKFDATNAGGGDSSVFIDAVSITEAP